MANTANSGAHLVTVTALSAVCSKISAWLDSLSSSLDNDNKRIEYILDAIQNLEETIGRETEITNRIIDEIASRVVALEELHPELQGPVGPVGPGM